MKGVILSYGIISAEDGKRYTFDTLELKNLGNKDPMKLDNSEVDFEVADENKAINIFITKTAGFDMANKLANFNKEEVINNAKNVIKNFTIDGFCAFIQDHSLNAAKLKGLISAACLIVAYFGIFSAAFGFLTFVFATLAFYDLFKSRILTGLVVFTCFVLCLAVASSDGMLINFNALWAPTQASMSIDKGRIASMQYLMTSQLQMFTMGMSMYAARNMMWLHYISTFIAGFMLLIISIRMIIRYKSFMFLLFSALMVVVLCISVLFTTPIAYVAYGLVWYRLKDPKQISAA